MNRALMALATLLLCLGTLFAGQAKTTEQLAKEVRHEIVMLPWYGVFDYLKFSMVGNDVTLEGEVTNPALKSQAGNVVRHIKGIGIVSNKIEVLPPSPMDFRLRMQLYKAIYRFPPLGRYAMPPVKPIRIIVKNGNATLEGVVDNEGDKELVFIRANGVPGLFSVTNDLVVGE
jgi:hyperosmotically inducible protein